MLRPLAPPPRARAAVRRVWEQPLVVRAGVALVVAQVAFRAWALAGSWFYFDDLAFMSRAMNLPPDAHYFLESYGGHLMPAGFAVIRVLTDLAVYRWGVWAVVLLVLQALAGLGMLRLLRSMFGDHLLVLALLAGYLCYVFTLSAGIWFAAGINQLPMQVALVFGLHSFLAYLRSRSWRPLAASLAWTLAGLVFYEKSLLLIGLYAILTAGWFVGGNTPARLKAVWTTYRPAVLSYAVLGGGYVAAYAAYGLNFSPTEATDQSLAPLAYNLVGVAGASAAVGGPLGWRPLDVGSFADPSQLLVVAGCAAVASLGWYAHRTRTRSARAWLLVGFTLLADLLLLSSARANIVGPDIALEYRYQTETAAVLMLGVGLALLPLRGAVERNELRPDMARPYEQPRLVAAVAVVVAALSLVSSVRYVGLWQERNHTRAYVENVTATVGHAPERPTPIADRGIPQTLLWAYRSPENNYSHVFANLRAQTRYPRTSLDALYTFDDRGRLSFAEVDPVRTMVEPGGCGYSIDTAISLVPLDGPVIGGGWWIRLTTISRRPTTLTLVAGEESHRLRIPAGLHNSFYTAAGEFTSVRVSAESRKAGLCVTALSLGGVTAGLRIR